MKRLLAFLLSFSVILTCIGGLSISVFAEGDLQGSGTPDDPYLITSAADFALIANDLTADYKQTANFKVTAPIKGYFKGTYDGDGHTIDLALTNSDKTASFALFCNVQGTSSSDVAEIKNLTTTGFVTTTGAGDTRIYSAAVLGATNGGYVKLENIKNYASVTTDTTHKDSNTGGIAGRMFHGNVQIIDSFNYGNVSCAAKGYSAGIVAMFGSGDTNTYRDNNKILRCANFGDIINANAGAGICAWSYSSTMESCYNEGLISGINVAGISVLAARQILISNCYNMGALVGSTAAAGIMKTTATDTKYVQNVGNCYNIGVCDRAIITTSEDCTKAANVYTLYSDDKEHSRVTIATEEEIASLDLGDAFTTLSENADNDEYNKSYPYPQLNANPLPLDYEYVEPLKGAGEADDPYLIGNAEQFAKIIENPTAYYKQTADITGITTPIVTFSGTYDGDGHSINVNLTSEADSSSTGFGLFCLGTNAKIKNLTITGSVTNTNSAKNQHVGAIVGLANGPVTIDNCTNYASVSITKSASGAEAGGILGRCYKNTISVTNCKNYGKISVAIGYAAGIVAMGGNDGGVVSNCANFGEVTCGSYAAGIVALPYLGVTNSYNFGKIIATGDSGRAAGIQTSLGGKKNTQVDNCFNAGEISGKAVSAAIAINSNASYSLTLNNCYSYTSGCNLVYKAAAGSIATVNCFTTYADDTCAGSGTTVVSKADLKATAISADIYTTISENEDNESYNTSYPYPQIKSNLVPLSYNGFIDDAVEITEYTPVELRFAYENGKYLVAFTAEETADSYKVNVGNILTDVVVEDNVADVTSAVLNTEGELAIVAVKGSDEHPSEPISYSAYFGGGQGTAQDPYLVYDKNHFGNIELYPTAEYKQMEDITDIDQALFLDERDRENVPVGTSTAVVAEVTEKTFKGIYDGNNKSITYDITVANDKYAAIGLFAHAGNSTIKNLTVNGKLKVTSNAEKSSYIGGLIGQLIRSARTTVTDVVVNVDMDISMNGEGTSVVGGVVGRSYAYSPVFTATNVKVYGNIAGGYQVGGIVGITRGREVITNCAFLGTIDSVGTAGGIVGKAEGGTFTNCYNLGAINATYTASGIIGWIGQSGSSQYSTAIKNVYNAGTITGSNTHGIFYGCSTEIADETTVALSNAYNLTSAKHPLINGNISTIENVYFVDDASEDENAVTLEELEALAEALGDAFVISGDYKYPQLKDNLIPDEDDAVEFVKLTYDESKYTDFITRTAPGYVQNGSEIEFHVKSNNEDFYGYSVFVNGIDFAIDEVERKEFAYVVNADTLVSAEDVVLEAGVASDLVAADQVFKVENEDALTVDGQEYTRYALVAAKAPKVAGLKISEFGVLVGNVEDLAIGGSGIKAVADSSKIANDKGGAYGVLIYGSNLKANTTYYTRPYAIYKDIEGNEQVVYGWVKSFVFDTEAIEELPEVE